MQFISISLVALFLYSGCDQSPRTTEASTPPPDANGRLDGQIFVVTKAADTIKLSLTDVLVFREADLTSKIAAYNDQTSKQHAAAQQHRKEIMDKMQKFSDDIKAYDSQYTGDKSSNEYQSKVVEAQAQVAQFQQEMADLDVPDDPSSFFADLPAPLQKTTTDSDGKFSVTLPKDGRYIVVASSSRQTNDKMEQYYWAVRLSFEGDDSKSLMLTNKNLVGSFSSDSSL